MGIRPTDLPVSPAENAEIVRRVERNTEAQEFGQKEQPARRQPQRRSGEDPATPHDEVEVSAEYRATVHPPEETAPPDRADAPPEKHLDIRA